MENATTKIKLFFKINSLRYEYYTFFTQSSLIFIFDLSLFIIYFIHYQYFLKIIFFFAKDIFFYKKNGKNDHKNIFL